MQRKEKRSRKAKFLSAILRHRDVFLSITSLAAPLSFNGLLANTLATPFLFPLEHEHVTVRKSTPLERSKFTSTGVSIESFSTRKRPLPVHFTTSDESAAVVPHDLRRFQQTHGVVIWDFDAQDALSDLSLNSFTTSNYLPAQHALAHPMTFKEAVTSHPLLFTGAKAASHSDRLAGIKKPQLGFLDDGTFFVPKHKPKLGVPKRADVVEDAGYQGMATAAGRHHNSDEHLNDDAGQMSVVRVSFPPAVQSQADSPSLLRKNEVWRKVENPAGYLVRFACIFDGHGPAKLNNIQSSGSFVSKACTAQAIKIELKNIGRVLEAPLLCRNNPEFLTRSRQAAWSDVLNNVRRKVIESLPASVLESAGTTATLVLASTPLNAPSANTEVLCCNLGDSRSVALTFCKSKKRDLSTGKSTVVYTPYSSCVLTAEENITIAEQQHHIINRLLKVGFSSVSVSSSARAGGALQCVLVPSEIAACWKGITFSSMDEVAQALRKCAVLGFPIRTSKLYGNPYTAFAIRLPYLYKIDVDPVSGVAKQNGLQVTQ